MRIFSNVAGLFALALVLAIAGVAYAPGLHGGFLFDDYANLPAIGATGPVDTWATFWRYITSGTADPTGRPLALLSFLLDARDWPADPWPFLRTNLVLHLVNGVLLAWLLRTLGLHTFAQPAGRDRQSRTRHAPTATIQNKRACSSADCRVPPMADPDLHARSEAGSIGNNASLRINLAAVLGAAFWLLHPLFVSTTLYIVQREAMLPATFVLLGLLAWLHGRRLMLAGRQVAGLAWLVLGLGMCTALAVLSKANGILLPALALVLEYTLARAGIGDSRIGNGGKPATPGVAEENVLDPRLRGDDDLQRRHSREGGSPAPFPARPHVALYQRAMLALAWLPAALLALYLLHAGWSGMVHGISAIRPWTLGQRLLTEPRILMDYLGLLWLPRPFTPGLFNDFIQVSSSLLHPATTLPAILAVVGLIAGAIALRRRWPAMAVAILFYFVGQSVESGTLALELYFEHRNYLPALLLFWPLALWLCGLPLSKHEMANDEAVNQNKPGTSGWLKLGTPLPPSTIAWIKAILAILLVCGLALMTHARASLWGNQHDQALLWARLNPDSPRAQAYAAQAEIAAGQPRRAIARLRPLLAEQPDEVQVALNLFGAECLTGQVGPGTVQAAETALETTRNPGSLLQHWFERLIGSSDHPLCPQAGPVQIARLLGAGLANPKLQKIPGRLQDLLHLKGALALKQGHPQRALNEFDRALAAQPRIATALRQAALLGSSGHAILGLAHLDQLKILRPKLHEPDRGMPQLHAWILYQQGYWKNETDRLRKTLQHDAQGGLSRAKGSERQRRDAQKP